MRYQHLDLNLLVALDVLLDEQNITRAAGRLHMTQSATSGVLNRLRTYFEDDLLTQVGRKMRPTPLAEELREPVRDVLMKIQTSIARRPVDEPATSKRHFRIMASDYVINVMLKDALQTVHLQAPNMTFEFFSPDAQSTGMLNRGELDIIVAPERFMAADHPAEALFDEEFVCLAWAGQSPHRRGADPRCLATAGARVGGLWPRAAAGAGGQSVCRVGAQPPYRGGDPQLPLRSAAADRHLADRHAAPAAGGAVRGDAAAASFPGPGDAAGDARIYRLAPLAG